MKRVATAKSAASGPHVTKQQFAYETLRAAILKGELMPGTRLVIDDLARRFAFSIIPVREALRLLQSEGLVLSVAHVGATVAPISRASVAEVFTLLEGLEVVAARTAAERGSAAALDALATIVSDMDEALDAERPQRWAELNTRFHLAISDMTAMPMLQEMMQRAFDHWGRVRTFYFSGVLVHRARRAQAEHHLMLDHLRTRDIAALEVVVREHNRAALAAYTAYLDSAASTPVAITERNA
jgi:DNA-binding GntR family transcriptional regulator